MGRTKNNLVELLLDKIILGIAALASLLILIFFVIGNSGGAEVNGQKYSSSQIDKAINEKAQRILEQLKQSPADSNEYKSQKPAYLALMNDSINTVKTDIIFPKSPFSTEAFVDPDRKYKVPAIENIANPTAVSIKMAAYIPAEELSETLTYADVDTKLADVDLVTVESNLNAKKLYDGFRQAFAGKSLPEGWRSEQYAKPVFAIVELQRRTAQPDGTWSDWEQVPRTKICHLKKTLALSHKAAEYETQLSIVQFAKPEIMYEILQPSVYDNAIPSPWLCPSLYKDRTKRLEREETERKRLAAEAEKAAKLSEKAARSASTTRQSVQTRPSAGGMDDMGNPDGMRSGAASARQTQVSARQQQQQITAAEKRMAAGRAPASAQVSAASEFELFKALMLTDSSKPEQMEKLVFWAHDDTTVPGEKYQYRMRIGIFNPIVGKDWFNDNQKALKEQTVLYSNFTEPTETIEITERLQFFPTNVREMQRGSGVDKTIEIKVARYTLGNWVSKVFNVKNGDQIGAVVDAAETRLAKASEEVKTVDLSTNAIAVDCRRMCQWSGTGTLKQKDFDELLYSTGDNSIKTMPIRERFWPENILKLYKEISQAESEEPVVLLTREQARSGSGYIDRPVNQEGMLGPETPGGIMGPDMGPDMMPGGLR